MIVETLQRIAAGSATTALLAADLGIDTKTLAQRLEILERMGYLVRVVCRPEDGPKCARVLAEELGTLGVRSTPYIHRFIAERTVEPIPVTIGTETRHIDVKHGLLDGKVYTSKPEFEQVRDWATALGLPFRAVSRVVDESVGRRVTEMRDEPRK